MTTQQNWDLGRLKVEFQAPDQLRSRAVGEIDATTIRAFNRLAEELAAKHGKLYLLADMSGSEGMTPDARRIANEYSGEHPFAATAFHGGSFAVRTVLNMMVRAAKLLGRHHTETQFLEDEASARAWLEEQKQKAAAKPA